MAGLPDRRDSRASQQNEWKKGIRIDVPYKPTLDQAEQLVETARKLNVPHHSLIEAAVAFVLKNPQSLKRIDPVTVEVQGSLQSPDVRPTSIDNPYII